MPGETSMREPRITGEDILSEILRNMEEGLFRIRYSVLVPALYRVYLHPDDYEQLRNISAFVAQEIKNALSEQLERWNRPPKGIPLLKRSTSPKTEYKRLADDWTVEFLPDADGKLQPREIEIHSELGAPQKLEYGAGSLTRKIFQKQPESAAAATARIEPVFGSLHYEDRGGQHTFQIAKNQVVIGRGGTGYWVDVKLDTVSDVSREHCRLRRDAESGQFFIKDVSQFGTTVNGKPIPGNTESPLPAQARIGLAEAVFLDFDAK